MKPLYDYKKYAVLYVDDEIKSLKYFQKAFSDKFRIFIADNAGDALEIVKTNKDSIGILITDQQMPGEKGVQLLSKVLQIQPQIQRILVTAYGDIDAAIDAVNLGSIYHYVTKPWDLRELEQALIKGLEFVIIQNEKEKLLKKRVTKLYSELNQDRIVRLSNFLAGLNHHIRNSLVPVKTFLDLAPTKLKEANIDIEQLNNSKFWVGLFNTAQKYVDKLNYLIQNLDSAFQPSKFNLGDKINLADAAQSAIENIKGVNEKNKVAIKNRIPNSVPAITGDLRKIVKLFELLIEDEAMNLPDGSLIELNACESNENQNPTTTVCIEISDDGPGLPDTTLKSIFDPLFVRSDDPQEFGTNLITAFMIVYYHGGKIEARNNENNGLSFIVNLPIDPINSICKYNEEILLQTATLNEIATS